MEEIIKTIANNLGINAKNLSADTNLIKDLEINSFDLVSLICAFEEKYDIVIKEEEVKQIKQIKDIVYLIETKKG